jgi:hypothetical protein
MYQNRISGFDMGLDDQQGGPFGQALPVRLPRVVPAPPQLVAPVSMSDIVQAAVNRAMQDYELDRLFNPEYYDYQI